MRWLHCVLLQQPVAAATKRSFSRCITTHLVGLLSTRAYASAAKQCNQPMRNQARSLRRACAVPTVRRRWNWSEQPLSLAPPIFGMAAPMLLPTVISEQELLIIEVEKYPWIYNYNNPSYKDASKRHESWRCIARALARPDCTDNPTAEDCQRMWRTIRDRLSRELKVEQSRSGAGATDVVKSQWPLLKYLGFLKAYLKPRRAPRSTTSTNLVASGAVANSRPLRSVNPQALLMDMVDAGPSGMPNSAAEQCFDVPEFDSLDTGLEPSDQFVELSLMEDDDRTPTPAQLRGAVSAHGSNGGNLASSTTPASVKRRQPAPQGPSKKKASEESVLYESLAASLKQMSSKCTRDHIDTNDPSTVIALGIRDKLRELSNDDRAAAELKINTLLYNMKYGNKQA